MNKIVSALGSALLAISFSTASAKDYKIAVTDIQGLDALISEWGPFSRPWKKQLGIHLNFFQSPVKLLLQRLCVPKR